MPGGTTVAVGVVVGVVTLGALITYQYRGAVRPRSRRRAPGSRTMPAPTPGPVADAARSGDPARTVERTYLVLTLLTTLASSFIWGINTIFLLDAGLNNAEAFAANAFFTVGQVIFEVPTGVVADTRGRQFSYVLGAGDAAPVDPALPRHVAGPRAAVGLGDRLDPARARLHVLLRARPRRGSSTRSRRPASPATSSTSSGGPRSSAARRCWSGRSPAGVIAQATNLGVPYLIRAAMLGRDDGRRDPLHARPRVHAAARRQPGRRRSGTSSAAPSTAASATRRSAG